MKKHPTHTPRYLAFVATSIDGRISVAKTHPPDWTSKEDWLFFQKALSRVDAVVVGRNTYTSVAERLSKRNTFVLSSRPKKICRRGTVTFVNPVTVPLAPLFARYKTVAVLGGGMVYRFMLENGLLDELFVTIEPLVFGRGKEMFVGGTQTTRLRLHGIRQLNKNGTILLHYHVLNHNT